jgi:STE24 endopeptidase
MNEDKATRYHRLRRRAILAAEAWKVLCLSGLLVSGLSSIVSRAASAMAAGLPAWLSLPVAVALWVVAVSAACGLGGLPLSFYAGFTLERRYGLSRQAPAAWLADHARASGMGLVYAVAAAVWIMAWLTHWPSGWWLAAWAGFAVADALMAWAAPVLLLPAFYRIGPLRDAGLRERLLALASRAGVPAVGILEWRLGDRSSRTNAALVGIGATRRIILSDTLITDYPPAEIEAVVAHELAHHAYHDIWRSLAVDGAVAGLALALADRLLRAAAGALSLGGIADIAGLPVVALTFIAVGWLASPVVNALSRAQERRADRFALDLTRDAGAFASAMRRLGARNLADEAPTLAARVFFHTHPPISDRVASAREWVSRDGAGGATGGAT